MPFQIVLPLYKHISEADASELAALITEQFQLSLDALVEEIEAEPIASRRVDSGYPARLGINAREGRAISPHSA